VVWHEINRIECGVHVAREGIPFGLGQMAAAIAPSFFEAKFPTAKCTGGGCAWVKHEPRIAVVVAFGFEPMQFSVGDDLTGIVESGGAKCVAENFARSHSAAPRCRRSNASSTDFQWKRFRLPIFIAGIFPDARQLKSVRRLTGIRAKICFSSRKASSLADAG